MPKNPVDVSNPSDDDLYAAELAQFVGDGHWAQFVEHLKGCGYSEEEVDKLHARLMKRAGRDY